MMLNKRQEKIIKLLENTRDWMTGNEISRILNVTDRTIRSDIEAINKNYNGVLIESNRRTGYNINQKLFSTLDITIGSAIPQTPQERCSYILHQLVFNKNGVNILDLQDEVFVSNYSIENDLKQIKKIIEPYEELHLVNAKNQIFLEGQEKYKRKLYKDMLTAETKGNFLNLNNLASFYKNFDLLKVMDIFNQTLEKFDYKIQGAAIPMLMIHLGIAIERMTIGSYITVDGERSELKDSVEYKIAESFYSELVKKIKFNVMDSEVILLAILIRGKKFNDYRDEESQKDKKIISLVNSIIVSIRDKFDIDFNGDKLLKSGLEMHIQALIERVEYKQSVRNIYLKEIKWKYPLIFEMAIEVANLINRELMLDINEDEIGFITLHLGAAYERVNQCNKYKVVLIQPHEQALSSMCRNKIESRFGDRMEVIDCFDYFEEAKVESLEPDIIISTLPLAHHLPIVTVLISLFVNYEDESKIFQVLNILDKNRFQKEHAKAIEELIDERFYYYNLDLGTRDEVIDFMCDRLLEAGYISTEFKESVHEREKISATSFAYSFAIPHSLNINCYKSNLSVAILKSPILWGDYDVQMVILLAISDGKNEILRTFFDSIGTVLSDSKEFAKLIKIKTRNEFVKQFMD